MTVRVIASDYKPKRYGTGHRWGHWRYVKRDLALEYITDDGYMRYDITLNRCRTSAQILDWLCQISQKSWATPEDVGNLLKALDDLAGGLQGCVCSFGHERGPITWSATDDH